jgi:CheY-like chemotaxis protein
MAKILLAASSEPRAALQRILADHDLSCPETLEKAEQMLRNRSFDLIVCTVFFDESRMFDLLRLAKSTPEWQSIPFVCVRLRKHVLEASIAREAIAFTCKSLGAVAFLDVANYQDPADAGREMRAAIERALDAEKNRPNR